mmetsp:Transcript_104150/g.293712  ORF Transcript_104150/g.293712 Transcript_104150/m.293712 type:complete len:284 (-) Transcript_104150:952-1803(-)
MTGRQLEQLLLPEARQLAEQRRPDVGRASRRWTVFFDFVEGQRLSLGVVKSVHCWTSSAGHMHIARLTMRWIATVTVLDPRRWLHLSRLCVRREVLLLPMPILQRARRIIWERAAGTLEETVQRHLILHATVLAITLGICGGSIEGVNANVMLALVVKYLALLVQLVLQVLALLLRRHPIFRAPVHLPPRLLWALGAAILAQWFLVVRWGVNVGLQVNLQLRELRPQVRDEQLWHFVRMRQPLHCLPREHAKGSRVDEWVVKQPLAIAVLTARPTKLALVHAL